MGAVNVPVALSDRLGEPSTAALIQMFEEERQARTEAIVQQCTDRFERRLVEETSKVRDEIAGLRGETRAGMAELRTEMAVHRFELLKWMFLFWVGQFVSIVGFVGLMLRMRP